MENRFDLLTAKLLQEAEGLWISLKQKYAAQNGNLGFLFPEDFQKRFFSLVDQICRGLLEEKDHFYGYFLIQMKRELRAELGSPTGVQFKGAGFVICFDPLLFLQLTREQMASTIKHEILHILSLHLTRATELQGKYSPKALSLAMDGVVNKYLTDLPPYAATLQKINNEYNLSLEPGRSFEYYAEQIQNAIDLLNSEKNHEDGTVDENDEVVVSERPDNEKEDASERFDPEKSHELWRERGEVDERTLLAFTEKLINDSRKGELPHYLDGLLAKLTDHSSELPWNLYLKQMIGTVEGEKKKTITRRNRRQPDRLELRGELRSHRAKIAVALDISGSISDGEFRHALQEVLQIVKSVNYEITVIECDQELRRVYTVKSQRELRERLQVRGATRFSPVIEYANRQKVNLLVYFTDGKGEADLSVLPRGYRILWVLSGENGGLSLRTPYGTVKKLNPIQSGESIPILTVRDVASDGYSMHNQE